MTQLRDLILSPGANAVRHDAVFRPVATANHISGAANTDTHRAIVRKVRLNVRANRKFRPCFGSTVGIRSSKTIGFPVTPDPFHSSRKASSTLIVPKVLVCQVRTGSEYERRTMGCAAR